MRFETTAGLLKSALQKLSRVTERRNIVPVLSTVLFDGKTLRATDLDMHMTVTVPATVAKGKAAIALHPMAKLLALISSDETVSISADKDKANLAFSSGRYDLPCCPVDDFPADLEFDKKPVQISASQFRSALEACIPTISTEDTRYYLNGVCLDNGIAVSTDGHRLSSMPCGATFDKQMIIPRKAVHILTGLSGINAITQGPPLEGGRIKTLRFKADGVTFAAELIDGAFPDWRRVVPTPTDEWITLVFERLELLKALRRVQSVFPPYDFRRCTTFAIDSNGCCVSRFDAEGIAARELIRSVDLSGFAGQFTRSVNVSYLIDLIKAHGKSGKVTFDINPGAPDPMVLRSEVEGLQSILMPMRGGHDEQAVNALHEFQRVTHPPKLQAVA